MIAQEAQPYFKQLKCMLPCKSHECDAPIELCLRTLLKLRSLSDFSTDLFVQGEMF